ncbi:DUF1837 domain-containing protein [Microcoleus sp. FACHB-SPT15]|uniref:Hachiman antiphage defense system protein HamA n=1 Tax=Microcoleus sp. FACHB-SPT15 TaxID=2692830 RepID=UPI001781E9F6|nr:Hachiman antiphage defense system protein HamA [Microcoleus sp. FACHB-SPT15]MBD1808859.1 DUF1837 domain-containing protein [Microcoleus sp. FACHB-SPT15]
MTDFLQRFTSNLTVIIGRSSDYSNFEKHTTTPESVEAFIGHLKILIPYFCRHPRSIIDEIEKLKENGLDSTLQELRRLTRDNSNVWRGTIGEAIATAYILSCTDYQIPIFKLRLAPNRKLAMHGDDLLGFQFKSDGTPKALLVLEAKNYQNPSQAVINASKGLLDTQKSFPTLFDFIINALNEKGKYKQAISVKNFLNTYTYSYHTKYYAFIVSEQEKWKDDYFDKIGETYATPLTVNAFLVPFWELHQTNLTLSENIEPTKLSFPSIEVNELEDIRNLLNHPAFKNEHNQLASEALASDLKIKQRANYVYDRRKLEQAAHYLSISGLNLMDEREDEAEKALKEAAVIHERLAILNLEDGQVQKACENIIESALLYSIAGYNANAKVLVEKVLNRDEIKDELISNVPRSFITYLFTGDIAKLQNILANFFLKFQQQKLDDEQYKQLEDEEWMDAIVDKVYSIGDLLTAKSFAVFIQYLRTGNDDYLENIIKFSQLAAKQYATVSDYSSSILLTSLSKYFCSIINSSTHKLVKSSLSEFDEEWKLYLRFLSTLGKFPMQTLWKSQQKALKENLLGEKSLVIAMPTSAGKTKTVELAIYQALKDDSNRTCVYVVPTRALACEVEDSLSKSLTRVGIGVSILYGGYDFSHLEEDILKDNQVFVLTPEKLDLLIRNSDEFKNKLSLIIIDEAHDSASPSPRSLTAELIYSRLLYIAEKNQVKIICISAVINNPSDFAKWVSGSEDSVTQIDWRPTRQRLGCLSWFSKKAQVQYFPQPNEYPFENFFVPLPFKKGDISFRNRNGKRILNIEVAARLALYYTETGPTLVFTTTKHLVEEIVHCLIALLASKSLPLNPERDKIAAACTSILGKTHLLSQSIKLGFCYHHGDLPANIRKLIENGVRDNVLSLIVSTTTLSQGVNLPIKNVIVHSLSLYGTTSMTQYANAVGRAGRAGCETEGHIIFCDNKDLLRVQSELDKEKSESFIASGLRQLVESRLLSLETTNDFLDNWALASTSQLRQAVEPYDKWLKGKKTNANKSKERILATLDSQLLAWILETCIDEVKDEKLELIFNKLLCNVQVLDFENELISFKNAIIAKAIAIRSRIPEFSKRKLFNFTGLSVQSNEIINSYAQELCNSMDSYSTCDELSANFWKTTYAVFKGIPEISKDLNDRNADALIDWIQGKDYQDLANTHFDGKTEAVVRQLEKVSYAFAWGTNSLVRHLDFYLGEAKLPNIFYNLSSFITHGVPDAAAVYAISLGAYDRQIAINLSKVYRSEHSTVEYSLFKEWLFDLDLAQWIALFDNEDSKTLRIIDCFESIQRRKGALQTNSRTFSLSLNEIIHEVYQRTESPIELEELIVINYEDQLLLTTYDYSQFWQLEGLDIDRLKQLNRKMSDLIVTEFKPQQKFVKIQAY